MCTATWTAAVNLGLHVGWESGLICSNFHVFLEAVCAVQSLNSSSSPSEYSCTTEGKLIQ